MSFLPFRAAEGPKKEEKTDYHSINKTNRNLKQGQKQKAAFVFSPRKSLCPQSLCVANTQAHTDTHTHEHTHASMLVMALFLRKVNSSQFSML